MPLRLSVIEKLFAAHLPKNFIFGLMKHSTILVCQPDFVFFAKIGHHQMPAVKPQALPPSLMGQVSIPRDLEDPLDL